MDGETVHRLHLSPLLGHVQYLALIPDIFHRRIRYSA
jgi:hypothetical protein